MRCELNKRMWVVVSAHLSNKCLQTRVRMNHGDVEHVVVRGNRHGDRVADFSCGIF